MSGKRIHPGVTCVCEICGREFHPPKSSVGPGLQVFPGLGKYCSHKCSGIGRRGPRHSLADRLWRNVNKDGPVPAACPELGPCWLWTKGDNGAGYGLLGTNCGRSTMLTHRLSFELEYGPIPDGLFVLHRCDVRRCCRPTHLFLGDARRNAIDMIAKGKNAHLRERPSRGEANGHATLTEGKVREIRARKAQGQKRRQIAEEMQLGHGAVNCVWYGRTWRHIK